MSAELFADVATSTIDETVKRIEELEDELEKSNQMLADVIEDNETKAEQITTLQSKVDRLYNYLKELGEEYQKKNWEIERILKDI